MMKRHLRRCSVAYILLLGLLHPTLCFLTLNPFLRWAREQGLIVGIVSNAEYRYKDVVLPALAINQGSEWDFGVFSGIVGVEKPDPRIYEIALEKAGNIAPEEALHIGDSMRKDYMTARSVGMQALLLDRFTTGDAESWRKSGAVVLPRFCSELAHRGERCGSSTTSVESPQLLHKYSGYKFSLKRKRRSLVSLLFLHDRLDPWKLYNVVNYCCEYKSSIGDVS